MIKKIGLLLSVSLFLVSESWAGCPPLSGGNSCSSGIKGTVTNDNAVPGNVGEYVSASVTSSSNFGTTANYKNAASIILSPGDWDVSCLLSATANGSTTTQFRAGISTDSGATTFSDEASGDNSARAIGPTASYDQTVTVASYRVSIPSTTTIYFKARADYSAGTPQYMGRISARRVR